MERRTRFIIALVIALIVATGLSFVEKNGPRGMGFTRIRSIDEITLKHVIIGVVLGSLFGVGVFYQFRK